MANIPRHQGRADPKIGPSDSSDTISDRPDEPTTDSDAEGTGVRPTVGMNKAPKPEISTDRVVDEDEAGLGGGLDEAEEGFFGVTDEELGLDKDPLAELEDPLAEPNPPARRPVRKPKP